MTHSAVTFVLRGPHHLLLARHALLFRYHLELLHPYQHQLDPRPLPPQAAELPTHRAIALKASATATGRRRELEADWLRHLEYQEALGVH